MKIPKYRFDVVIGDEALVKHDEELCRVAAHEAGHFIMSILIDGSMPRGLSIVPTEDSAGRILGAGCFASGIDWISEPSTWQRSAIRRDALMMAAGAAVEELSPAWDPFDDGWANDFDAMGKYLDKVGEQLDYDLFYDYVRFVQYLLRFKRPRRAIRLIVDTILEKRELDCHNGLYDLMHRVERELGSYRQSARQKIENWVTMRDINTNAHTITA